MGQTKTDNSKLAKKVRLRINHLPGGDLIVLDCYTGRGTIWKEVKKRTGRSIKTLPIDTRKDIGFHLPGDNVTFLVALDLTKFNVVDLDAYGIPYEQLRILFERKYHGVVFVTFIQSIMGGMTHSLLEEVGFTKEMIIKCPTLYAVRGWDYFLQWLAKNGITKIWHYSFDRKHYLCFEC